MLKKLLVLVIMFLFFGLSVVSSTENMMEDVVDIKDNVSQFLCSDKRFYAVSYTYPLGSRLIWFDPDDQSTLNEIGKWPNSNFPG